MRHVLRALTRSKCSRPIGHCHLLALALLLSFVAAPLAVDAQQSQKVYRIGMLERTSKTLNAASLSGFLQGMRELGYVEGKHFVMEYRSADGLDERFQHVPNKRMQPTARRDAPRLIRRVSHINGRRTRWPLERRSVHLGHC